MAMFNGYVSHYQRVRARSCAVQCSFQIHLLGVGVSHASDGHWLEFRGFTTDYKAISRVMVYDLY